MYTELQIAYHYMIFTDMFC